MIKVVKNGVVVSVLLDTRTVNKEGTYPVKIKVYFQGKPKYYPTGICMSTKEELEEVLESKSKKNTSNPQLSSSASFLRLNVLSSLN